MKIHTPFVIAGALTAAVSSAMPAWSAVYHADTNIVSNAHFEVRIGEMGNLNGRKVEFIDGISYAIDYWSGLFGNNYLDRGKVSIDFGAHSLSSAANCASNQVQLSTSTSIKEMLSIEDRTVNGKVVGTMSSAELLLKHGIDVDAGSDYQADMTITFNPNIWYAYATNVSSSDLFDLPSMIIHEMAHGLGVNRGGIVYSSALGQLFAFPEELSTWEAMYNVTDYKSLTLGSNITIGDPSWGLEVYNPLSYNGGSSFIHVNPEGDPSAVMLPTIAQGDVKREFSEKELALFQAMGWLFVPEPSSSFLVLFSLPAFLVRRRRSVRGDITMHR